MRVEPVTALVARDPNAPVLREVLAHDPSERVRRRAARELSATANDPSGAVRDRAGSIIMPAQLNLHGDPEN